MKKKSTKKPREYEISTVIGRPQLTVNFMFEEKTDVETGETVWEYRSVDLEAGYFEYGSIVSAIIDDVYTNDQMQAIVNNYLIGYEVEEFNAMQEFRVYAKDVARTILEELNGDEPESEVSNG